MPLAPITLAGNDFRERINAADQRAGRRISRQYIKALKEIRPSLAALEEKAAAAAARGETLTKGQLTRWWRQADLERQILEAMAGFAHEAGGTVADAQGAAISLGQSNAKAMVDAALPAGIDTGVLAQAGLSWNTLPEGALANLQGTLGNGAPLDTLLSELPLQTANAMENALTTGLIQGFSPRKIAARMTQAQGIGLTRALRISRTEILRSYRESTRATYEENSDIVKGYRRLAAKDSRTCMGCIVTDGKFYELSEPLPAHVSCRCTTIPETVTYEDLGLDVPEPDPLPSTPHILDVAELSEAEIYRLHRGSDDLSLLAGEGYDFKQELYDRYGKHYLFTLTDAERDQALALRRRANQLGISVRDLPTRGQTGREWFHSQRAEVQRAMMGRRAYEEFQAGRNRLDDGFVQTTVDAVWGAAEHTATLAQMGIEATRPKRVVGKRDLIFDIPEEWLELVDNVSAVDAAQLWTSDKEISDRVRFEADRMISGDPPIPPRLRGYEDVFPAGSNPDISVDTQDVAARIAFEVNRGEIVPERLWRGKRMSEQDFNELLKEIVPLHGMEATHSLTVSSFSRKASVATDFMGGQFATDPHDPFHEDVKVIFTGEGFKGWDVSLDSAIFGEAEVITGGKFRIKRITELAKVPDSLTAQLYDRYVEKPDFEITLEQIP